jgi:hypothetical protein
MSTGKEVVSLFPSYMTIYHYTWIVCKRYNFADGGGEFGRALYDYEATAPEELSFYEGQIIKIIRRVSCFMEFKTNGFHDDLKHNTMFTTSQLCRMMTAGGKESMTE